MLRSTKDLLAGIFTLLVAGVFYVQSGEITGVSFVFPKMLMIFLTISGAFVVMQGLWRKKMVRDVKEDDEPVSLKRITIISTGSIAYVILIPYLGFYPASIIFLLLLSFVLSDSNAGTFKLALVVLLFTAIICLTVWLGFGYLLSVPTPEGSLFS